MGLIEPFDAGAQLRLVWWVELDDHDRVAGVARGGDESAVRLDVDICLPAEQASTDAIRVHGRRWKSSPGTGDVQTTVLRIRRLAVSLNATDPIWNGSQPMRQVATVQTSCSAPARACPIVFRAIR